MNQQLHIVTLGVNDLEVSKKFYTETLGWKPSAASNDGIVFFQTNGGVVLALFPREELAADATMDDNGFDAPSFTLAYNAYSAAEVDEIISGLKAKGVKIVKEPQRVSWGGYSSYFADPNGYLWEVAYNPFFEFDENGNLKLD